MIAKRATVREKTYLPRKKKAKLSNEDAEDRPFTQAILSLTSVQNTSLTEGVLRYICRGNYHCHL